MTKISNRRSLAMLENESASLQKQCMATQEKLEIILSGNEVKAFRYKAKELHGDYGWWFEDDEQDEDIQISLHEDGHAGWCYDGHEETGERLSDPDGIIEQIWELENMDEK